MGPNAQDLPRPVKFDWSNATLIALSMMQRALMDLSNLTYDHISDPYSTPLYSEVSVFNLSGRRASFGPEIAAWFWFWLSSSNCWAPHYLNRSSCRHLLVNKGYLFPWRIKVMLNEIGDWGTLVLPFQRKQHGSIGWYKEGRIDSFDVIRLMSLEREKSSDVMWRLQYSIIKDTLQDPAYVYCM